MFILNVDRKVEWFLIIENIWITVFQIVLSMAQLTQLQTYNYTERSEITENLKMENIELFRR